MTHIPSDFLFYRRPCGLRRGTNLSSFSVSTCTDFIISETTKNEKFFIQNSLLDYQRVLVSTEILQLTDLIRWMIRRVSSFNIVDIYPDILHR